MQRYDNKTNPAGPCEEFEQRLVLYVAQELEPEERVEVEKHLESCSTCSAALARERRLLEVLVSRTSEEPSANLLASCREVLEEKLDEILENQPGIVARWSEKLFPGRWFALHPAFSAALFVLIGFSVGTLAPRLLRHPELPSEVNIATTPDAAPAPVAASLDDQALRTADVAGIDWTPSADNEPPRIEVQLSAERPMVVQGTVNSSDVKRVLLTILRGNARFSPEVRLDAVELLKARNNDPDVRQALCSAVHTDGNAAVRLRALEALNGAEPEDIVRKTLIDALLQDSNPGVRIEAINTLRGLAERGAVDSDARLIEVLRERARKDPNPYIRLQSASAIRNLGPREKY